MQNLRDIGGHVKVPDKGIGHHAVAGAGSDNVEKQTTVIDRLGFQSLVAFLAYFATLTDTKKADLTSLKVYQSDDGSSFDGGTELLAAAVNLFTAANPTLTKGGAYEKDIDLSGYKRYLKFGFTVDMDASATDVVDYGGGVVLGGGDVAPV